MSENSINFIAEGVELQVNEPENLAAPSWLAEALLVGQCKMMSTSGSSELLVS